jgi:carboxylesterase type B
MLVGSNTEETRLFFLSDGSIDRFTDEAVSAIAAAYGLLAQALSAYRAMHPNASAGHLFSAIQTDWYWRIPATRLADAHATSTQTASTYMYEFAWRSPQFEGRLGAAHAVEIPFVFDTLGLGTGPLLGPDPPQALAAAMHEAWVRFAAGGDCGWPKYGPVRKATMRFDTMSKVVDDPLAVQLALWKGVR